MRQPLRHIPFRGGSEGKPRNVVLPDLAAEPPFSSGLSQLP
jgi:hypothetical protein